MGKKGGTQVISEPASIPEATPEERALQAANLDYVNYIMPSSFKLADMGMAGLNNQVLVDYQNMYRNGAQNIQGLQSQFANLQNGVLPDAYRQNKEAYINEGVKNTLGSQLNSLANRGVVNSSITSGVMNNLQKNVANQMAQGFGQDIATQSQLIEQGENMAYSPLKFGSAVQSAALENPMKLFTAATGQYSPSSDAWKTMYGARYSIATPAQSYVTQDQGFWGGLMQGVGAYLGACFAAGTMIYTPDGIRPIETIQVGDYVITCNEHFGVGVHKVIKTMEPVENLPVTLKVEGRSVITTDTQSFLTPHGFEMLKDLKVDDLVYARGKGFTPIKSIIIHDKPILVYDLTVEHVNAYIANGFVVNGGEE